MKNFFKKVFCLVAVCFVIVGCTSSEEKAKREALAKELFSSLTLDVNKLIVIDPAIEMEIGTTPRSIRSGVPHTAWNDLCSAYKKCDWLGMINAVKTKNKLSALPSEDDLRHEYENILGISWKVMMTSSSKVSNDSKHGRSNAGRKLARWCADDESGKYYSYEISDNKFQFVLKTKHPFIVSYEANVVGKNDFVANYEAKKNASQFTPAVASGVENARLSMKWSLSPKKTIKSFVDSRPGTMLAFLWSLCLVIIVVGIYDFIVGSVALGLYGENWKLIAGMAGIVGLILGGVDYALSDSDQIGLLNISLLTLATVGIGFLAMKKAPYLKYFNFLVVFLILLGGMVTLSAVIFVIAIAIIGVVAYFGLKIFAAGAGSSSSSGSCSASTASSNSDSYGDNSCEPDRRTLSNGAEVEQGRYSGEWVGTNVMNMGEHYKDNGDGTMSPV